MIRRILIILDHDDWSIRLYLQNGEEITSLEDGEVSYLSIQKEEGDNESVLDTDSDVYKALRQDLKEKKINFFKFSNEVDKCPRTLIHYMGIKEIKKKYDVAEVMFL